MARSIPTGPRANGLSQTRSSNSLSSAKRLGPSTVLHSRSTSRGAVHRFDNNGSQDVKSLCLITPAAIGPQYFREAAELLNAAAGGPPDRAKMAEIMRRHGLTPAPPPPQA